LCLVRVARCRVGCHGKHGTAYGHGGLAAFSASHDGGTERRPSGPPAANRGADATAATNKLFSAATHGPGASALSPQARGHLSCPPAPSLAHHVPTCTISPSPSVDIDVTQLPATWMPATPEEELAEMSQTAEFVQLEPTQFIAMHARRVKRLMECFDDGCGVSATTAAQKSIAPPVRVAGTNNRHPAWASALFFQKVARPGTGHRRAGAPPDQRPGVLAFQAQTGDGAD
ncbi:uncharacterized protein LOC112571176, partial [Pomacea canaliculata]|uniref:uncharacterized protein LOC112571176 n=1 Tax=Pomacea canaliculata TaxID=400727 RepID=UPI000D738CD7